jgi:23S rRNA G2445 N2-methylase RlmL
MKGRNPAKEHYQRLRVLSCERLWDEEVSAFDRGDARERMATVAVVRAVGVVFSESGTLEQKAAAREWLLRLLDDPEEKIRRYAMNALPKLGADAREEEALHSVLRRSASDREKMSVGRALEKIGGEATLEITRAGGPGVPDHTARKVAANVARLRTPSAVLLERSLPGAGELRIHLRARKGLEPILEDELREHRAKLRVVGAASGVITVAPLGAVALADVYALRCFSSVGIALGKFRSTSEAADVEALAALIASPLTRRVLETFTEGPLRYRLEFVSKGHQRGMVRRVAARVYELCPALLNDSRDAPWQIDIFHAPGGVQAELVPRLRPDPRFAYRRRDVPAASHPPLAACMARLAGELKGATIWDPFCGSGLELIETALRGGVRRVIGTDRSAEAIAITEANFAAAISAPIRTTFASCDFRDYATVDGLRANAVSLVITNPPLGRRVPIPNLRELIDDLFSAAVDVLEPGGRLVFVNPLSVRPAGHALKQETRRKVDLGGFNCHLEMYRKTRAA